MSSGVPGPAEGDHPAHDLDAGHVALRLALAGHRRVDDGGRNGVGRDAVGGQLAGEGLGEAR